MQDILKMTGFLVLVCAVSALALAFTDDRTAPLISEQDRRKEEEARKEVLPGAATFEEIMKDCFRGMDASGDTIGYVGKAPAKGFGGRVEVIAGVDPNGRVTGVKVLKHKETPGLGTRAVDPKGPVIRSMVGKGGGALLLRKDDPRGEVDAITGVTITSRALAEGVDKILKEVEAAVSGKTRREDSADAE